MPDSQFKNFCVSYVSQYNNETDANKRVASLLVEQILLDMERYTGTNALDCLAEDIGPQLTQEGLHTVGITFLVPGYPYTADTVWLLEEYAIYVAEPESYVAPPVPFV